MIKGVTVVLYPVSDLASAKALFTRLLGVEPMADEAYYVGFQLADQHIGLDPNGARRGMTGATPFFEVGDIRDVAGALAENGAPSSRTSETLAGACSSPCSRTLRET
jgi:catechol 2,3-dioxygenase-like lactoylglutathione lyase family enzyme